MSFVDLFKSIDRFFFSKIDLMSLSIFRILFATLCLAKALLNFSELEYWYGSDSIFPIEAQEAFTSMLQPSLLKALPELGMPGVYFFWGCWVLASLCLIFGLYTRFFTVLLWAMLCSFDHRNTVILNSGDTLLRNFSFWMIFAPSNAYFSLDQWRKQRKNKKPIARYQEAYSVRLLQLQMCLVYLSTFLYKMEGSMWIDGSAIYYTTRLVEFQRFPIPFFHESLIAMKVATWFTLFAEFTLGILIWFKEWRYTALLMGLALHVGIEWSMNIPLFEWAMVLPYILFIKTTDLQRFLKNLGLLKSPVRS